MKKMAMKVSVIARGKRARSSVWNGKKLKTATGLKKGDLMKNKTGKLVSRKASLAAKKKPSARKILAWANACSKARKSLGIKGFCPVGGKSAKGQALLKAVRSFYKK